MDNLSQISLKYLSRALMLRWRAAIVTTMLLFAGLAAYVLSLESRYTSAAVVLLTPTADELAGQSSEQGAPMTDPFFVRSETAIISSDELSRSVIERLKPWTLPEFQPQQGLHHVLGLDRHEQDRRGFSPEEILMDQAARDYKDRLSVLNDGRSKTVEIAFTASDPRAAADIANAHAEAYLQQQSSRRGDVQQKSIEWLAHEVDARAAEVRAADEEVQQYQLQHGIVSTNDATMVEQRLSQLSTQLVEAQRQLATQTAMLAEIRQIKSGGDAGNAAAMLANEPLKNLLRSRVEMEANVASLEKRLAPGHPTLVKQRQELASVNNVLGTQVLRLENEAASNVNWWQRQVQDLGRAVDEETSSKVKQDKVTAALPALLAQAQVKRRVFETVLNRYQTLLAERALLAPAASIVSHAVPSAKPSFPQTSLLLVIAAMVSMFAGAVAAVGLQLRKSTSLGLTAVADALGIRPLVAVPRFRNASRVNGTIQIKDPRLFIESIRFLRDAILDGPRAGHGLTCLITSVLPRQGKSLVAMSLARAIARSGGRTLFIELDLRQPTGSTLARRQQPAKGLAAVLEGRVLLHEVIARDESTGLHMLLAEKDANNALDRLTTPILKELLTKLRNHYDAIIVDSPPVGIVSDALTLIPLVDQTIIVAKDGASSIAELKRGTRLLKERGATLAGLVLTSTNPDDLSSVDKKTLHRYVMGMPSNVSGGVKQEKAAG